MFDIFACLQIVTNAVEFEDFREYQMPFFGHRKRIQKNILAKIVYRKGIGDLLANGSNAIAEYFNISEDEIATVVGLEVTYHDLRSNYGMAIAYGIGGAYKGPSHNACDPYLTLVGVPLEELGMEFIDKYDDGEKMAEYCSIDMDYRALYSSIIMCSFCNPLPSQQSYLIQTVVLLHRRIECHSKSI